MGRNFAHLGLKRSVGLWIRFRDEWAPALSLLPSRGEKVLLPNRPLVPDRAPVAGLAFAPFESPGEPFPFR